jgi:tetratricopeptide (TPR) repeat protein
LDYRTYIGLAQTYLRKEQFDKAKIFLEKSISHAPLVVKSEFGHNKQASSIEEIEIMMREESKRLSGELDIEEKKFNTFNDYKSYSYRLLGYVYACEENYDKAVSCLKSAIALSPQYADGYYDYAQYCAQTGNRNECITSLSKAITGKSLYYYLSRKEKNFDPIRSDIESLIIEIYNEAMQRVKT